MLRIEMNSTLFNSPFSIFNSESIIFVKQFHELLSNKYQRFYPCLVGHAEDGYAGKSDGIFPFTH